MRSISLLLNQDPVRVHHGALARERYGEPADRLITGLMRSDPLADAVVDAFAEMGRPGQAGCVLEERILHHACRAKPEDPAALAALLDSLRHVPTWFDEARADRGGRVVYRSGIVGAMVLALKCLVRGYVSPGGNKPLIFSGRLQARAQRRLAETSRFVQAVCAPKGMSVGAHGFVIAARVRLMHAMVRRLSMRSDRWSASQWGVPINQHDMLATVLLFSQTLIRGLQQIGAVIGDDEADDLIHLWRYIGWVMGVEHDLLPDDMDSAQLLSDVIDLTQGPPDDDSRALVEALLHTPLLIARSGPDPLQVTLQQGLVRAFFRRLNGDTLSDRLGIPETPWRHAVDLISALVNTMEGARSSHALLDRAITTRGTRYWHDVVIRWLGEEEAAFLTPDSLERHVA